MERQPADDGYDTRLAALRASLRALGRVAVAYSGGVDSSVLLHAAFAELGEGAVGLIADSPSLPRRELDEALALARAIGVRCIVLATDELADPTYVENRGDRCYFCKAALFRAMESYARTAGIGALAFGEIVDDFSDHRPGAVAAREAGIHAPLSAAGLGKADVRRYAREHALAVADKPASACLASRLPVGTRVTRERLARVERAEEALRQLGLRVLRVRDRGDTAGLEVGRDELDWARAHETELERALRDAGFAGFELSAYRTLAERTGAAHSGTEPSGAAHTDALRHRAE